MPNANATLSEKIVDAYLTGRDDAVIDAIESTFNDAQTRLNIDSFAELATVTDADTGDIVVWREKGFRYQCVTSGEDFDYTGSGGLKWKVLPIADGTYNFLAWGPAANGSTDDSAKLILARARADGSKLRIPAGHYKFDAVSTSTTDLVIEGDGESTILDFTGTITGGDYALEASGTLTQIEELNGSPSLGATSLTFASAPSLSVGDVFLIFNPTNSSYSGFRTNYKAGEWCEVEAISGSTVTLKNPLYAAYTDSAVDIYKVTDSPKVHIKNVFIKGTTILGLVNASRCIRPIFETVKADHANNSAINIDRCFRYLVSNPDIINIGDGGDDYGIAIGNSQHGRIIGGDIYARRHAVTHGGNSEIGCVPVRDCLTIGSALKNDIGSGVFSADFHGNAEHCKFIDCTIFGGATLQGKNNTYDGCTIYSDSGGRVLYHSEVVGGRLGCINCHFVSHIDPSSGSRGIYDIGGNNSAITSSTTEDVTFFVENCSVFGRNMSNITSFVIMKISGSSIKTNITIDGIKMDIDDLGQVLFTSSGSGTPDADFIIVDNLKGLQSGVPYHTAGGSSAFLNFPHRMPEQSGTLLMTATSGTHFTLGSAITYDNAYPRAPNYCGVDVIGGYNNNRMVIGAVNTLTATAITPIIHSGDATNWASTATDRTVNWFVGLKEV